MVSPTGLLLGSLVLFSAVPTTAQTNSRSKLDESLQEVVDRGCRGALPVIIRTEAGYRQGLVESLAAHGDVVLGEFTSVDAVAARVHCDDLATLASFGSTKSVSVNARVSPHQSGGDDNIVWGNTLEGDNIVWGNTDDNIVWGNSGAAHRLREGRIAGQLNDRLFRTLGIKGARRVRSAHAGLGTLTATSSLRATVGVSSTAPEGSVGVAVIDSGIEPGPDFGARLTAFYDFTGGDVQAVPPSDAYGHGTHVAGLIGSQFVGVAPGARLVGLKVLDARGQGFTTDVIRAIEFAVAHKAALGLDVLNVSLGHPIFEPAATDPLVQAVEHAVRAGLVVVVSAGNFGINPRTGQPGYAGIVSPGNAPSALTVGAVQTFDTVSRHDDRVAPYSSRGPTWYDGFAKPDVVAPGHDLLSVAAAGSTLRQLMESRGNTGDYMRLSGTSMAAGVASGLAALVLATNGGLTPNALKAVLEYTAVLVEADPVVSSVTSSTTTQSTTTSVLRASDDNIVWGNSDDNIVWGNSDDNIVWGNGVHGDEGVTYADALTQGAGSVNGAGALRVAAAIDPTVPVGEQWLRTGITPASTLGGARVAWSQRILWGNHFARGTGVIDENRPAWALNVVWGDFFDDNIVWGNSDDNIVWGNAFDLGDNIVWGNNIVWADSFDDNIVWGNNDDNIVWGNFDGDNIVWGNNVVWGDSLIGMSDGDNIVWGNTIADDNIVWGNLDADNIVWGNLFDDNIVWGNDLDNIVWGNDLDNIVWGNVEYGSVMSVNGGRVGVTATAARARRTRGVQ